MLSTYCADRQWTPEWQISYLARIRTTLYPTPESSRPPSVRSQRRKVARSHIQNSFNEWSSDPLVVASRLAQGADEIFPAVEDAAGCRLRDLLQLAIGGVAKENPVNRD